MTKKDVNERGWHLSYELKGPPDGGGLVIQDILHNNHPLARDTRVVRVWVSSGDPLKKIDPKGYILGSSALPPTGKPEETFPIDEERIKFYRATSAVSAKFETANPLTSSGNSKLRIEQEYVFTNYSNTPSHEPSGKLQAARFYPLAHFSFSKSDSESDAPQYIRLDFRLELSCLPWLTTGMGLEEVLKIYKDVDHPNQAGIFLDAVDPNMLLALDNPKDQIFAKAEKPLRYEVIGQGLMHGSSKDWDNIHQWGMSYMPPQKKYALPSTPGGFHCIHEHWRWFAAAHTPSLPQKLSGGFGKTGPHLAGPSGPGSPIVDADNLDQNLRFAILESKRWPLERDWGKLPFNFMDVLANGPTPNSIETGANLVRWISISVFRNLKKFPLDKEWKGTIYVHGIFFSHSPEDPPFESLRESFYKPLVYTKVPKNWNRSV
jgi:hypothetical protein